MEITVCLHLNLSVLVADLELTDDCIYNSAAAGRVLNAFKNGHQIASHTWAHRDLTTLSWDDSQCFIYCRGFYSIFNHIIISLVHNEMWLVERMFTLVPGSSICFAI